jgi:hypothetical protein
MLETQQNSITFRLIDTVEGLGQAGQQITMALRPEDTYTTQELDTWLAGYRQTGDFRMDEVAPAIPIDQQTTKLRYFTKANTFRRIEVKTSMRGAVQEVDVETEVLDKGPMTHRALGTFIPAPMVGQSSFDLRTAGATRINDALALDREYRGWTLLVTSGSWAANNRATLTSGLQWGGASGVGASSHPIKDMQARRVASAAKITDWWMNEEVGGWFISHPDVVSHMRQMLGDAAPSPQVVTQDRSDFVIPGVGMIHIVGGKILNESTGVLDYILGDTVIGTRSIAGIPTGGNDIATVKTLRVRGPSGTGFISRSVNLAARGYAGGELLIVGHQEDIFMTSDIVGGAIFDVLQ